MSDALNATEPWKQLRLSLEQPYKDDSGNRIPVLFDLTPEGERIYELKEPPSARLEANLRRIFLERGPNFFEQRDDPTRVERDAGENEEFEAEDQVGDGDVAPKPMTVEELYAMRMEILPQLFVALGEMSQARDLLTALLANTRQMPLIIEDTAPSSLSATTVTKPAPIVSVQAFNAQLTVGGKDEALRKASRLFKTAAESMERSRARGEKYWVDALRARRANWGLSPAPLPLGSATGKGADKTSKDFMISYGLEGSPPTFRRRAIAQLPTVGDLSKDIVFPFHQSNRLRISITITNSSNSTSETSVFDSPRAHGSMILDTALKNAQVEIVDQEIFSLLVKESGNLPTVSAQVSERLIMINAAQELDLKFELVDSADASQLNPFQSKTGENICELIYHVLHVLLLRKHGGSPEKSTSSSKHPEASPAILHPIIDILQYRVFCERIELELRKATVALNQVGIPSALSFTVVGESGERLASLLSDKGSRTIGGEALIRLDDWHRLRFTMVSPSTLTAHLSQATLNIFSLPQLSQLLMDELERCLLQKICMLGREMCLSVGGIWFVDLDRCVARWDGCVLNFQISFDNHFVIGCSAFRLDSTSKKESFQSRYTSGSGPLLDWVKDFIQAVL